MLASRNAISLNPCLHCVSVDPDDPTHEIDGVECEPIETLVVDAPNDAVGSVMELVGGRKGELAATLEIRDVKTVDVKGKQAA